MKESANLNYIRRLPHIQPPGAVLFVTFSISGSLPVQIEEQLKQEANLLRANLKGLHGDCPELIAAWKKLFRYADEHWHKSVKNLYLKHPVAARSICEAIIKEQSDNHCRVHRYCIMPNHVHLLIEPLPENATTYPSQKQAPAWPPVFYQEDGQQLLLGGRPAEELIWRPLWKITKQIKGSTSSLIAKTAGVPGGKVWVPESFDHWIRNAESYRRVVEYIDQNPVKAGLCRRPEEWEFSSVFGSAASTITE